MPDAGTAVAWMRFGEFFNQRAALRSCHGTSQVCERNELRLHIGNRSWLVLRGQGSPSVRLGGRYRLQAVLFQRGLPFFRHHECDEAQRNWFAVEDYQPVRRLNGKR